MNMKPIINHDAVRTVSAELPTLAGNILAGGVALLLISGACGGRVWAITGGQVDTNNIYSNVGAMVYAPPGTVPKPEFSGTLIHPRVFLTAAYNTGSACIACKDDGSFAELWTDRHLGLTGAEVLPRG